MSDELVKAVRAAINAVEYAGANVIIDAQLAPGEVDALARAAIAVVIERCAEVAECPGFVQARDTEWDAGFNYAKRIIATAIRIRGKEMADG